MCDAPTLAFCKSLARVIISPVLRERVLPCGKEAIMSKRCRRLWALLVLSLLVCGCSAGSSQGLPFQDNFDDPNGGWGVDQRPEFGRGYEEGGYFIALHQPNWFAWTYPGMQLDDVSVEVDVFPVSDSQDSHFGVLCRHADVDNFYYFAISADGYYAIFRRVGGGDLEVLTGDGSGMIFSSAIRTGGQANRVLAVCQGDELSLYVNGELLETVTDDVHTRGDIGLGAGSGPTGGARIRFDNFSATGL